MKTRIILAMFFSALITFNSFAKTYKVIQLSGCVSIRGGALTNNQTFEAATPRTELQLGTCTSITVLEAVKGASPETFSRGCPNGKLNCAVKAPADKYRMASGIIGKRREALDAYALGIGELSQGELVAFHNENLQFMGQERVIKTDRIERVDKVDNKVDKMNKVDRSVITTPQQSIPINKVKTVQRQR